MTLTGRHPIILTALIALIAASMGVSQALSVTVPGPDDEETNEAYVDSWTPEPEEMWDSASMAAETEPPCIEPVVFVPGQGDSCRTADHLWKVYLDDGSYILTHGGDPRISDEESDPLGVLEDPLAALDDVETAGSNMPECWSAGSYRFRAVYAYQASAGSSYTTQVATIRARINETNYHFDTRAHGSSYHHELRFSCLSSNRVTVSNAGSVSCTSASTCSFAAITNKVKGYSWGDDTTEYYIIFWKGPYSYCGQGGIQGDDSDSANNANNVGPQYSVIDDGCWSVNTILHEMTHNMGGAQYNAPESSGSGWHCNDGYDILCYSDGGDKSNYRTTACASSTPKIYDCNRNTYCDNKVTSGEWLDTHWNICDAYNRFATKTSF